MEKFQYVFIDSGIGGIPYLNYLLKLAPKATALYIADSIHFPYGEKKQCEVISFTLKIVERILENVRPEIIILACNTMTVSALKTLRNTFDFPFVGTVPAIKPANLVTKNNRIGLISTERTAKDIYTQRLIDKFLNNSTVFVRGESDLVEKIENGLVYETEERKIEEIRPIISFFEKEKCDTLILGCTHFLHLRDSFIKVGKSCAIPISIVDSLEGVINHTLTLSPCKTTSKKVTLTTTGKEKQKYKDYANRYGFDFIEDIQK
jgi:hypothetical protein